MGPRGRIRAGSEDWFDADWSIDQPDSVADTDEDWADAEIVIAESHRGAFGEFAGESSGLIDRTFRERILLVGVTMQGQPVERTDDLLDELERLVDTAGADVVARVHQRRRNLDPATYIGKGKVEELKELAIATDCDTVVFDDELTPAQQFNLEKLLGRTALDRTAVILDIFAQNASSIEGKAQVEVARLPTASAPPPAAALRSTATSRSSCQCSHMS